jgi:hypothetical protein
MEARVENTFILGRTKQEKYRASTDSVCWPNGIFFRVVIFPDADFHIIHHIKVANQLRFYD